MQKIIHSIQRKILIKDQLILFQIYFHNMHHFNEQRRQICCGSNWPTAWTEAEGMPLSDCLIDYALSQA